MSQSVTRFRKIVHKLQPLYSSSYSLPLLVRGGLFFYLVLFSRYNGDMKEEKYSPYSQCCGRPMHYAPQPKCNYNDCCLNEYKYKMSACIRNKQPDCTAMAVIPSITVETVDGITNLANCFVHVTSTNTTYYIDDKHRPMIIWAGPVEADVPETVTTDEEFVAFVKTFNLHSQYLYARYYSNDTNSYGIVAIYFDKNGTPYWAGEYNQMTEEPLI